MHSQRDDEIRFYENVLTSKFSAQGVDNEKVIEDYNKIITKYSDLIFFTTHKNEKETTRLLKEMETFRKILSGRTLHVTRQSVPAELTIPDNTTIDIKELMKKTYG